MICPANYQVTQAGMVQQDTPSAYSPTNLPSCRCQADNQGHKNLIV